MADFNIYRDPCPTCFGTGVVNGPLGGLETITCPRCGGALKATIYIAEKVSDNPEAYVLYEDPCTQCFGTGLFHEATCPECGGAEKSGKFSMVEVEE